MDMETDVSHELEPELSPVAVQKIGTKRRRMSNEQQEVWKSPRVDEGQENQLALNGDFNSDGAERVVILDAGAQFGKVIDRRVRELSVESIMLPLSCTAEEIKKEKFNAIIISGGPNSVNDVDAPSYDPAIFDLGLPVLGICYGLQLINKHFGGAVGKGAVREDGQFLVSVDEKSKLFHSLEDKQHVLLTHGDSVEALAPSCDAIGWSGSIVTALKHREREIYGVQFHPEVDLTEHGLDMLRNFLYKVCDCHGLYSWKNRQEECIAQIREKVGNSKVLSLISGGVDSTVCTALLYSALGRDRVVAVHIDNGFMRKSESSNVIKSLEALGIDVKLENASYQFYSGRREYSYRTSDGKLKTSLGPPLHSVTSPEEKRHIIGDTFIKGDTRSYSYVAALSSNKDPASMWLDLMKLAKLIPRICHNINRVVWVFGGPVPGPVQEVTPTYLTSNVLATLRQADALAMEVLREHNMIMRISQMPVVLIPVHFDRDPLRRPIVPSCKRSVVIRTFITSDYMTGIPATPGKHLPLQVLEEMVQCIQRVSGVSRVLYDLTPKPPGTTEWE